MWRSIAASVLLLTVYCRRSVRRFVSMVFSIERGNVMCLRGLACALVMVAMVGLIAAPSAQGTTWNLADDWDTTDGVPNLSPQVWKYQTRNADTGAFNDIFTNWRKWWGASGDDGYGWTIPVNDYPAVGPKSSALDHAAFQYVRDEGLDTQPYVLVHPGNEAQGNNEGVVSFLAPAAGLYSFSGTFWHVGDIGNGVGVSISQSGTAGAGDTLLTAGTTGMTGDTVTLEHIFGTANDSFSFNLSLAQNDEVHFRVNHLGSFVGDSSLLKLDVAEIPEPSSIILLGFGLVSLLAYVWKRRR